MMKRTKKFQWMAAMMTAMAMTCVTMTSCSANDDNPIADNDVPSISSGVVFKTLDQVAVGDYVYDSGKIANVSEYQGNNGNTVQAVGVVAYVGQDAITENGVTLLNGKTLVGHCLVLSLYNAPEVVFWSDNKFAVELGDDKLVKNTADLKRTTDVSGYLNTKALIDKATDANNADLYPAAAAAWNYTYVPPTESTGWFLPSAQQWVHMLAGDNSLGKLNFNNVVWSNWIYEYTNPGFLYKMNAYCGTPLNGSYWTSSEYDWRSAVFVNLSFVDNVSSAGFKSNHKGQAQYIVRPVFAM